MPCSCPWNAPRVATSRGRFRAPPWISHAARNSGAGETSPLRFAASLSRTAYRHDNTRLNSQQVFNLDLDGVQTVRSSTAIIHSNRLLRTEFLYDLATPVLPCSSGLQAPSSPHTHKSDKLSTAPRQIYLRNKYNITRTHRPTQYRTDTETETAPSWRPYHPPTLSRGNPPPPTQSSPPTTPSQTACSPARWWASRWDPWRCLCSSAG